MFRDKQLLVLLLGPLAVAIAFGQMQVAVEMDDPIDLGTITHVRVRSIIVYDQKHVQVGVELGEFKGTTFQWVKHKNDSVTVSMDEIPAAKQKELRTWAIALYKKHKE
jgi:hypothetical protein